MFCDQRTELNKRGIGSEKNRPLDRELVDLVIKSDDSATRILAVSEAIRLQESSNVSRNHGKVSRNLGYPDPEVCIFCNRFLFC